MTLYEILAIIGPVLTLIIGAMVTYIFNSIHRSIDKLDSRIDKLDHRLGDVEKEVFFIKGLIEGKNLPNK